MICKATARPERTLSGYTGQEQVSNSIVAQGQHTKEPGRLDGHLVSKQEVKI